MLYVSPLYLHRVSIPDSFLDFLKRHLAAAYGRLNPQVDKVWKIERGASPRATTVGTGKDIPLGRQGER